MHRKVPTKCVIVPVWRHCRSNDLMSLSCQYSFDFKQETTIIVLHREKIFSKLQAYQNKTARWQHVVPLRVSQRGRSYPRA